ncbi:MAG: oligosaccharide flippase family protein, partial [Oscillospiraceae bacterium]|nr:oligosaccharide flippase family protein [Oscillospiraceae bacterium]
MTNHRQNNYLHGAAVLAMGVAIVKVIGAVYRIPINNILGDVGTSTFTVAFSIYQFLLAVSTAGLPVALSKMVASADALGRPRQVKRVFLVGRNAFVALGLVSFLVMAVFHRQLADFFGSPSAAYGILALSPAVLFVGLSSAYRGYGQGLSDMMPTSISQIIEAFVRLVLGLGIAWVLASRGFPSPIVVAGAILGVTVGTGISAAYLYFSKRRMERRRFVTDATDTPESTSEIFRTLRNIAIPLTLGTSVFALINMIDNIVILRRLREAAGLSYEMAQSLHGTYS